LCCSANVLSFFRYVFVSTLRIERGEKAVFRFKTTERCFCSTMRFLESVYVGLALAVVFSSNVLGAAVLGRRQAGATCSSGSHMCVVGGSMFCCPGETVGGKHFSGEVYVEATNLRGKVGLVGDMG
jgi:hypothetical protein